jgi:hypothetical protein
VRIKTGMASCNRAHLRSSFFDNLRGTRQHHLIRGIHIPRPHIMGQTSEPGRADVESVQTCYQHGDYRSAIQPRDLIMTPGQARKCNVFRFGASFGAVSN